jgi:predicted MFS family arabinose efflux permease
VRKPGSQAHLVLALGSFLFLVNGDNYAAALLLIRIAEDFGVGIAGAAANVVSYMLCFGLFTVIFGPLGDRFGKPRVLLVAATGSAAASLLSAFSTSLPILVAARAVNGAFAAGVMPVAMAYVGEISSAETRQRQIGKMMGLMFLGGALATLIGGTLAQFGSWRLVYSMYGVAELILLAPLFRSLRAEPRGPSSPGGFLAPYKEVLKTPRFLPTVSLLFFLGFATMGTFSYLGKYLQDRTGLGLLLVGLALGAYGVGTLVGGRMAARLRARWGRPFYPLVGIAGGLGYAGFGLFGGNPAIAAVALLFCGFGFMCLQSSVITAAQDLAPSRRGAAMSASSFTMVTSGALGTYVNGRIFSVDASALLFLAAAAFAIAGLAATFILSGAGRVAEKRPR